MTQGPVLVVMAAGMGSRYGGLKQMEPVGPHGEFIIDYSVYDAVRAGFKKIVFVIRRDFEESFRKTIGRRVERRVEVGYVFQSLEDLPAGHGIPPGRVKPWGTGHAVLSLPAGRRLPVRRYQRGRLLWSLVIPGPAGLSRPAGEEREGGQYCMVGFRLENTLTESGPVARGICSVDPDGWLREIHERTKIQRFGADIRYTEDGTTWVSIPAGSTVSMNAWGFTPDIFGELEEGFIRFLHAGSGASARDEYLLPSAIGEMVSSGKARVKVLISREKWYGMTYPEDRTTVKRAIADMTAQGRYPDGLRGSVDGSPDR